MKSDLFYDLAETFDSLYWSAEEGTALEAFARACREKLNDIAAQLRIEEERDDEI